MTRKTQELTNELASLKLYTKMKDSKEDLGIMHYKYINDEVERESYLYQESMTHFDSMSFYAHAMKAYAGLCEELERELNELKNKLEVGQND